MKNIIFLAFVCMLLFTVGCGDNISGKAVEELDTTTTTQYDDVTARYNKLVHNIDSDEVQEEVSVVIVDEEDDNITITTEAEEDDQEYDEDQEEETTTTTEAEEVEVDTRKKVSIQGNAISPEELYIKAGETVVWVNNEDNKVHMISSIYSKEFRSQRILPGEEFEHTFEEVGEYQYIDAIVPEKIRGKIIVE